MIATSHFVICVVTFEFAYRFHHDLVEHRFCHIPVSATIRLDTVYFTSSWLSERVPDCVSEIAHRPTGSSKKDFVLSNEFSNDHRISRNWSAVFLAACQPNAALIHEYFQDSSGGRSCPPSSVASCSACLTMSARSG